MLVLFYSRVPCCWCIWEVQLSPFPILIPQVSVPVTPISAEWKGPCCSSCFWKAMLDSDFRFLRYVLGFFLRMLRNLVIPGFIRVQRRVIERAETRLRVRRSFGLRKAVPPPPPCLTFQMVLTYIIFRLPNYPRKLFLLALFNLEALIQMLEKSKYLVM